MRQFALVTGAFARGWLQRRDGGCSGSVVVEEAFGLTLEALSVLAMQRGTFEITRDAAAASAILATEIAWAASTPPPLGSKRSRFGALVASTRRLESAGRAATSEDPLGAPSAGADEA